MLTPPAQLLTVHKCSYPVIHVILTRAHEGNCATDGGAGGSPPPPFGTIHQRGGAWAGSQQARSPQHPGGWYLYLYVSEMITPMPTHPPDLWTPPSSSLSWVQPPAPGRALGLSSTPAASREQFSYEIQESDPRGHPFRPPWPRWPPFQLHWVLISRAKPNSHGVPLAFHQGLPH